MGRENFELWRHPFGVNITSEEKEEYDFEKIRIAKENGFSVVEVWENQTESEILKLILEKIKCAM